PDLVLALALDAVVEVAVRDRPRALGEALDGHRDAARQVEAEPGGGEEDHDGDYRERDGVVGLDGTALDLEAQVLVEGALAVVAPAPPDRVPAGEDLDQIELVLGAPRVEEALERVAAVAGEETLLLHLLRELAREAERRAGEVLVVVVRDLQGALERALHLAV